MRKAILLDVTVETQLWLEGEDAPADDYAKLASDVVRRIIATGAAREHGVHVTIRALGEHEGS